MSTFAPINRPSDHPLVTFELFDDSIGILTLADQGRRNALRIELSLDLEAAVHEALAHPVRAIILKAVAPVFCSGGDLDDLVNPRASLTDIARGTTALVEAPVPTIALVDGPVIGAGINLALACDVILCTPAAVFDPRLLDLGVHPGGGQLRNLALRIGRQGAVALSLLGDRLTGAEAAELGLAWRCLPAADANELALTFARRAASRPPEAVARAKKTLDATIGMSHEDAAATELIDQQWSIEQPWIHERVERLRQNLAQRSKN